MGRSVVIPVRGGVAIVPSLVFAAFAIMIDVVLFTMIMPLLLLLLLLLLSPPREVLRIPSAAITAGAAAVGAAISADGASSANKGAAGVIVIAIAR